MKKFFATVVLAAAATVFAQTDAAQQQQGAQSGQKTIKDASEYNAYMSAIGETDPNRKAASLEAFIQQYPNSVVKTDAMAEAMKAYQQAQNVPKTLEMANALSQADPNNLDSLVVLTYVNRIVLNKLPEAAQFAQRGLQALGNAKPNEGEAPDAFKKRMSVISAIFNGAIGQNALGAKDYPTAQRFLQAAVDVNPEDVANVYPLALAYLGNIKTQPDDVTLKGLWYIARACNLVAANPQAAQQICKYGTSSLRRYHGPEAADDVWNQLTAAAKSAPNPPAELPTMVTKAPSPAQQVKDMLAKNPDVKSYSFGEWILIFTYGDQPTQEQSFAQIKDQPFKFQGQVISATPEQVDVALTEDGIQANKAEVQVQMAEPLTTAPAVGSQFQFQANPVSYVSQPSFLMTMNNGVDLSPKKANGKGKGKVAPKTKTKAKTKAKHK